MQNNMRGLFVIRVINENINRLLAFFGQKPVKLQIILLFCLALPGLACAIVTPTPPPVASPMAHSTTVSPLPTGTPTNGAKMAMDTKTPTPYALPVVETCQVSSEALHLRKGPGVDYAVIGYLETGETVTVLEQGEWLKVEVNKLIGYVKSDYCK